MANPRQAAWRNRIVGYDVKPASWFIANEHNWRIHPKDQQEGMRGALDSVGWVQDVIVNLRTSEEWGADQNVQTLVDGHLRVTLALRAGEDTPVPVKFVDLSPSEEAQVLATLDPIAAMAATDKDKLDELMRAVQSDDERVQTMLAEMAEREGLEYGRELADKKDAEAQEAARRTLAERFIVPPFSVLDARQGYWQERKRAWIDLGIESELGRGECVTWTGDAVTEPGLNYYRNRKKGKGFARCYGQDIMKGENSNFSKKGGLLGMSDTNARYMYAKGKPVSEVDVEAIKAAHPETSGTSIFDPVLCELVYRWFCPASGSVLDPFAGGSVRGIVASLLGHAYTGIDLRPEQIEANEAQAREICKDTPPRWIVGDSRNIHSLLPEGEEYDLVFSCPPYFDLEVYSEDDRDLSNAGDYALFLEAYADIIAQAVARLKHNRFACFVVGDIRDKQGFYRNFVSDTIAAFQDVGAMLYNEAILVTAVGSLPIRVGKQFQGYRKLGKTHQNVLVFYKGDPRKIREFGEVEAGEVTGQTPVLVN